MTEIERDKQLIQDLGGAAKLAELLGYDKEGGVQRVHNWTTRGIPSDVKLGHPEIFLKDLLKPTRRRSPLPTDKEAA